MLLLMLACKGPEILDSRLDSGGDTAAPDDTAPPTAWPSLDGPSWESADPGVATGLAWGDMDGDGDADLVVAYGNDILAGPVVWYANDGGVLSESPTHMTEEKHYYGHLALGDLDGDGDVDVAVSRFLGDGKWDDPGGVEVWLNDGGVLSPGWSSSERFDSFSCALGDVDRDGDLDLAVAVGEPYYHLPEPNHVFLNDGAGQFGDIAWSTERSDHAMDVGFVDIDEDGWLDLAFATMGAPHTLYLNQGGSFPTLASWTAEGADSRFGGNTLDFGDVDGDGLHDLVISDNDQLGGAGTVSLYCGTELSPCWESDPFRYPSAVSLEDVDGDGDLDLAAGSWWGPVDLYFNDDGLPTAPSWSSGTSTVVEAFGWADVDGSHALPQTLSGEGLISIPGRGRVLSVTGGVASDGYVSGPGLLEVVYLDAAPRDLALSNWDQGIGNQLYGRQAR